MTKSKTSNEQTETLKRLTQGAAAWLIGLNARTLRDAADCPRNPDRSYNGQDLVRWQVARSATVAADDPLLTGSGSPALERYRLARAVDAELNLDVRHGQLVPVDEFETWWQAEVASPIRRAVETLQRLGPTDGPTAAGIVAKALDKAQAAVEKRTGNP